MKILNDKKTLEDVKFNKNYVYPKFLLKLGQ